jgi:hypothetical protein
MAGTVIARHKAGLVYLSVNPATIADNVALAALAADVKIRICQLAIVASGGGNTITFKSEGAAISPVWTLATSGVLVLDYNELGWFEGSANGNLEIALSAATAVGVLIGYKHSTV